MLTLVDGVVSVLSRIRLLIALLLTAALVIVLAACSAPEDKAEGSKEKDQLRVVALDWRFEEILVALGVQPVGIVEIGKSAVPATLEGKLAGATSVGQAKQPNLEIIQSLEPDLILASPTRHAAIMDQLKKIAPTEAYPDATYGEVLDSMDNVAEKLGKTAESKEVRARIEDKIGQTKQEIKPGTRAALVGWSNNTLYTWVNPSFPASLLTAVGYEYGYDGKASAIESKTDVAELTGDKLPGMNLNKMYLYNDVDAFRQSPYADVVKDISDVDQDVWSRSRGPLSAEAMVDQILKESKAKS